MPSAVFCLDFRASRYCRLDISSGSLSCILLRVIRDVALAGIALRDFLSDNSSTADFSASEEYQSLNVLEQTFTGSRCSTIIFLTNCVVMEHEPIRFTPRLLW